jgi:hypothetical protein
MAIDSPGLPDSILVMPVLPVAPGTFTTGICWSMMPSIAAPAERATWSAPPPGPNGTTRSTGLRKTLSPAPPPPPPLSPQPARTMASAATGPTANA